MSTEAQRAWYIKNRARVLENGRVWRRENPEKALEIDRRNKAKLKARRAEYMREWRAKNPEKAKIISRNGNATWRKRRPVEYRKSANAYNDRIRDVIFQFFGEQCVKCGFTDRRALQMDHINGRGRDDHRMGLNQRYKLVVEQPDEAKAKFQILCANCNTIKRVEQHEYLTYRTQRSA